MRRSVLFFTFVLAVSGCGSDPEIATEPDVDERPYAPSVDAVVRPPPSPAMEEATRIDEERSSPADPTMAPRRLAHQTSIAAAHPAYCPSPSLCMEASHR